MSVFQAVNTTLTVPEPSPVRTGDETTPTTPRPNSQFFPESRSLEDPRAEDPSAKTPTRNSFMGISGQRPLPSSPFTPARAISKTPSHNAILTRENSHRSTQSVDSQDIEMGDDDDRDGSDMESVNSDSTRPSKKKKGQRFFCTDFPPCQLSFTRSEHLARHIRKHTGERPFQCHCSRRFSRLDNLRQHAQTVHVNEDIPGDSLAATGTRFQRQIRTDRVRPPGNRSRANTLGSQGGGHSRGHSRNLSSSSITSTASSISVSQPQDVRRRPPPLAMANDGTARSRLSLNILDSYNPPLMGSPGPQIVDYESNGATTPTSATFSPAAESPSRLGSALQSPISSSSRPVSWGGSRTPGRRLSVPSAGGNPFSGPPGQFPPSYITPLPSSTSSNFSSHQTSAFASPTASNFSESRRQSNADADWRRRTWHPGTYTGPRPATSGLGYYQTPDAMRPTFTNQPAASQTTRLPGIESFDHAPPLPALPRRPMSPMQIDSPPARPVTYHAPSDPPLTLKHEKRQSISWDTTLQRGINRLEIASPNPLREQWSHYQASHGQNTAIRPTTSPQTNYLNQRQLRHSPPQPIQILPNEPTRTSQDPPTTPRKNKRQAWYNGPLPQPLPSQPIRAMQRTSPEDSSSSEGVPTPSNSSMTEYHPAIVHSNGFVEAQPPGIPANEQKVGPPPSIMERPHPIQQYQHQHQQYHSHSLSNSSYRPQREPERRPLSFGQPLPHAGANDMRRLEALVAVATATGEQQTVGHRA